ncbi:hypothetical protein ACW69C_06475 [Streptomyces sp. MN3]
MRTEVRRGAVDGLVVRAEYQSRFAVFARTLDSALLSTLRITGSTVLVMEVIVSLCKALTNDSDSRPWQDRVEDCFSDVTEERIHELFSAFAEEMQGERPLRWMEDFKSENYKDFVERLLGAARYRLLVQAIKEDGAVVALALRRGVRALTPFAVAWSDAVNLMSKDQLKAVTKTDLLSMSAVQMLLSFDNFLGEKLLETLPMEVTAATATDLSDWAPDGVDPLVTKFRAFVTEASTKRVERANSALVRKIRGARDALRYSDDGISQAANSLIELIDRIMREKFPPKKVLVWIDANIPEEKGLTFRDKDGIRKPTKRGEALCFVYGGDTVTPREGTPYDDGEGPDLIHEVLALALVTARNKLQDLKHSDQGTPQEREQLMTVLSALEGALMLGLTLGAYTEEPLPPAGIPAA